MHRAPSISRVMNIDDFAKSPISALRAIFEEPNVRLSTLNSSKIAQALILDFLRSRLISTFYGFINIDGFVKSPIFALRAIFEDSHVRLSTLNSKRGNPS